MNAPGADATPRVLHLCTRFGTGGSERRIVDAVTATPDLAHALLVGSESDLALVERRLPGVPIEVVPMLQRAPHPVADRRAYRAIRRRVAGVDLVHTHQSKAGALGRLAASRAGVPVVHSLSMANFGPGFGRAGSAVYRAVERSLAGPTTAYAVVGHDLADRFRALGVPGDRLVVIRSGIDLDRFRAAPAADVSRRALGLPADVPLLAFVGRLERTKGASDLAGLLAAVRRRAGLDVHLVVAGEGPELAGFRREVEQLGLDGVVHELGWTDRVPEVLAAADAVVLPSRCEGLPQVLVQAIAVGTPFVAYRVDGAAELLARGAAGQVVGIGEVEAAAEACARLLAGSWAPPPGAPPVDLSEWEPETVADGYRRLYARVLAGRSVAVGS